MAKNQKIKFNFSQLLTQLTTKNLYNYTKSLNQLKNPQTKEDDRRNGATASGKISVVVLYLDLVLKYNLNYV